MTEKERLELANLLFPNITKTREDYEKMYPERDLEEGAMVTRYGPSPTGSVHLGNLLSAFADMVYAKQTNGSFYLRIEDTDQKRMIDGGIENITSVLHDFDILPNEGYSFGGNYGPYQQSKRTGICIYYVWKKASCAGIKIQQFYAAFFRGAGSHEFSYSGNGCRYYKNRYEPGEQKAEGGKS